MYIRAVSHIGRVKSSQIKMLLLLYVRLSIDTSWHLCLSRLKCKRSYHTSQVKSSQEASVGQAGFHIVAEVTEDSEARSAKVCHSVCNKRMSYIEESPGYKRTQGCGCLCEFARIHCFDHCMMVMIMMMIIMIMTHKDTKMHTQTHTQKRLKDKHTDRHTYT